MKLYAKTDGFFVLRTPLFPFEEMQAFTAAGISAAASDNVPAAADRAADRETARRKLGVLWERPEAREALFLGSADLHKGLSVWRERPESDNGLRIEGALHRYFSRMVSRATPFGLFAGCSVGKYGAETRLDIEGREGYRRRSRLDMEYLYALAEKVVENPVLRKDIVFRPNTSLYKAGGRYHYAEGRFDGKFRKYHLVAVDKTPYLEATLKWADEGKRARELAEALVSDDPEIAMEEAEAYISELIDSQVLVADLMPLLTGAEPVEEMIETLRGIPGAEAIAQRLDAAHSALAELDGAGVGANVLVYLEIVEKLTDLPAEIKLGHLFQVDMTKSATHLMLGARIVDEIRKGVEVLHRMRPPETEDALLRFGLTFSERYKDREVPLMEALDEEVGIGFEPSGAPSAEAAPLLAGIPFAAPAGEAKVPWTRREAFLFGKLEKVREKGDLELRLETKDLQALSFEGQKPLPDAYSAMASIAASSCEAIAKGQYRICLHGASGPSGARLLGRFCHADEELQSAVEAHLREEEALQPGAIFAEIVHLPEGRIGNILFRPCLREYEILFLGRSSAPLDRQIPIQDLMVSL